jgi:hypothetical protein
MGQLPRGRRGELLQKTDETKEQHMDYRYFAICNRRKLFWPLPIMASWPELFRAMEEIAKLFWTSFEKRESISNDSRPTCNHRAPKSFDESSQNLLGAIETKGKELQHAS